MAVLIAGVERSGTTWVATALSRGADRVYVHEPDNPDAGQGVSLLAPPADYQVLEPGDVAPAYERLWDVAFSGGWPDVVAARRAAGLLRHVPAIVRRPLVRGAGAVVARRPPAKRHVVVKSVHCPFSIEWIWDHYRPTVVVIRRNPLNVVASFVALGTPDEAVDRRLAVVADPRIRVLVDRYDLGTPPATGIGRLSWWVGLAGSALHAAAERHPEWHVVSHDEACQSPAAWFADLGARVGLPWTTEVEAFLADTDRPGTGYAPQRVTADAPTHWRRVLSGAQEREIRDTLAPFPVEVPA